MIATGPGAWEVGGGQEKMCEGRKRRGEESRKGRERERRNRENKLMVKTN
jgi:hypothetical protein